MQIRMKKSSFHKLIISSLVRQLAENSIHIYIHIPFCHQKCPYCKFALTPVFDTFKKKRYLEHLKEEIRQFFIKNTYDIVSIYFWWGTPSVLDIQEIQDILHCLPNYRSAKEISFECNPEDINSDYVNWLSLLGITRISLGVQTLNDTTLSIVKRSNRSSILTALSCIHTRMENPQKPLHVNVDFILWLPATQKWEILENIREVHTLFPYVTHTSVYMLEDGNYPGDWRQHSISEEEIQEDFLPIVTYFEKIGWNHYEISNFSKPGYESFHNQAYWNHKNYRGFGLSASSYMNWRRFTNSHSFSGYYRSEIIDEEVLTSEEQRIERIMFGLRTQGIPLFEVNPWNMGELCSKNLIKIQWENIVLTKTWIFLLDHIIGELIS